jgi:hypothetical protein
MKRKVTIAALTVLFSGFAAFSAVPAGAAEHHPPKFGVHSTQCSSDANQPNCPGGH